MTSVTLLDDYLTYLEKVRNISLQSITSNRYICTRWIAFLNKRGVEDVRHAQPQDVLAWIELRRAALPRLADRTVGRDLCILRTFYNFLVSFHRTCNPTARLPDFICKPSPEQHYLTVDEVFRMLETCLGNDPFSLRNYTIIALLWSTGLRSGELLSLQWRDIDLAQATLLVRKGKGSKQRQLYLNDRVLNDLRRFRKGLLAGEKTPVFCGYPSRRHPGVGDARLSQDHLASIVRDAAKLAGIHRKVTPMTLRHTFATHLYEAGVSVRDIQEMMGHNDKQETTIYIHVTLDAAKRLLNETVQRTLYYDDTRGPHEKKNRRIH